MNKKVQNYLSKNENTKLASIKEFIANHNADLKRAVALGLSTATVIGMLAGCNPVQNQNSNVTLTDESGNVITKVPGETMFPPIQTTRPTEEVIETGVTAEDVLAELNNICYDLLHEQFKNEKEYLGKEWETMSCDFTSIGNDFLKLSGQKINEYDRKEYIDLVNVGRSFNGTTIKNYYALSLTFNFNVKDITDEYRKLDIYIPAFALDSLMQSYQEEPIIVDMNYWFTLENTFQKPDLGASVYDGEYIFDKNKIQNANQNQLNALYEIVACIKYYFKNAKIPTSPLTKIIEENTIQ